MKKTLGNDYPNDFFELFGAIDDDTFVEPIEIDHKYDIRRENMELRYTYKKGKKYLVGWLLDYPEHPTQGIDIPDLERHLLEIYGWIKDGSLEVKKHYGILEVV